MSSQLSGRQTAADVTHTRWLSWLDSWSETWSKPGPNPGQNEDHANEQGIRNQAAGQADTARRVTKRHETSQLEVADHVLRVRRHWPRVVGDDDLLHHHDGMPGAHGMLRAGPPPAEVERFYVHLR